MKIKMIILAIVISLIFYFLGYKYVKISITNYVFKVIIAMLIYLSSSVLVHLILKIENYYVGYMINTAVLGLTMGSLTKK